MKSRIHDKKCLLSYQTTYTVRIQLYKIQTIKYYFCYIIKGPFLMFIYVMRNLSVTRKICRNDSLAEGKDLISFKGVVGLSNGMSPQLTFWENGFKCEHHIKEVKEVSHHNFSDF